MKRVSIMSVGPQKEIRRQPPRGIHGLALHCRCEGGPHPGPHPGGAGGRRHRTLHRGDAFGWNEALLCEARQTLEAAQHPTDAGNAERIPSELREQVVVSLPMEQFVAKLYRPPAWEAISRRRRWKRSVLKLLGLKGSDEKDSYSISGFIWP